MICLIIIMIQHKTLYCCGKANAIDNPHGLTMFMVHVYNYIFIILHMIQHQK